MSDPRQVTTTPEARIAARLADYERRLRVIERGQGAHAPQRTFGELTTQLANYSAGTWAADLGPSVAVNIATEATLVLAAYYVEIFQSSTAALPVTYIVDTAAPSTLIAKLMEAGALATVGSFVSVWGSAANGYTVDHTGGGGFGSELVVIGNGSTLGTGEHTFGALPLDFGAGGQPMNFKNQRLWVLTL